MCFEIAYLLKSLGNNRNDMCYQIIKESLGFDIEPQTYEIGISKCLLIQSTDLFLSVCYRAKDEKSDLGLLPNVSRLSYRPILKSPSFRYLL